MIGAIAGDIAGSRFEGGAAPPPDFDLFHAECVFTDDTVCTLAVAAAILSGADFALTMKEFVRRHPDRGYGGMFRKWALSGRSAGYGSWGNGAPMRVASVGWLATDEAEADRLAASQAEISHNHPDAVAAAQAVAQAILAFRSGADVDAVRSEIESRFGYDLRPEAALSRGGFDVSAAGTAPVALAAAFEAGDWEDAVRRAVRLGGDTDTLACIAGAVAEARHDVPPGHAERALPFLTPDLKDVLARFDAAARAR